MAIVNGKRLYNSDKLLAVAKEDDRAAAEYAWLMAGISDDFGRFKLSPRRILGKAYESRPGITELMIADWLAIYEKHGLIQLYTVGGSTYAEWYKYAGDPPSQRRFHSCPEPPWTTHKHNKRCTFRDDVLGMQMGRQKGRQVPTQTPTQLPTAPLPSVPSVPSVPSEQTTDPGADAPTPKWNSGAADLWWEIYKGKPPKSYFAHLKPIVTDYGWERVRPALVTYMAETDIAYVNIAGKFGPGFGTWEARARGAGPARASPAKETVADRSRKILGLPPANGGSSDIGNRVSVGTAQPERSLQSGAEPGRGGTVSGGSVGTDGRGVPGGGA